MSPEQEGKPVSTRECLYRLENKFSTLEVVVKANMAEQKRLNVNIAETLKSLNKRVNQLEIVVAEINGKFKQTWMGGLVCIVIIAVLGFILRT